MKLAKLTENLKLHVALIIVGLVMAGLFSYISLYMTAFSWAVTMLVFACIGMLAFFVGLGLIFFFDSNKD